MATIVANSTYISIFPTDLTTMWHNDSYYEQYDRTFLYLLRKVSRFRSIQKHETVIVKVLKDNSEYPVKDWLDAKENILEWYLGLNDNVDCLGNIKAMENALFSCPTQLIQILPSYEWIFSLGVYESCRFQFHIVSESCIHDSCFVLPNIGSKSKSVLYVHPRNNNLPRCNTNNRYGGWASNF